MVKNLRFVYKVIVEENMAQKVHDVQKFSADVFCLGSDYETIFPLMAEYKQLVDYGCRIVFIERTKGISTSILKELKE